MPPMEPGAKHVWKTGELPEPHHRPVLPPCLFTHHIVFLHAPRTRHAEHQFGEFQLLRTWRRPHWLVAHARRDQGMEISPRAWRHDVDINVNVARCKLMHHKSRLSDISLDMFLDFGGTLGSDRHFTLARFAVTNDLSELVFHVSTILSGSFAARLMTCL